MKKFLSLHWDFLGFSSSTLCAIHCVALPFLLTFGSFQSLHFLHDPWLEWTLILMTFIIASVALSKGYIIHKKNIIWLWMAIGFSLIILGHQFHASYMEGIFNGLGGMTIAFAHYLNWNLIHRQPKKVPA